MNDKHTKLTDLLTLLVFTVFALCVLLVLLTGANLMISWLLQQIIDLSTGMDIGFTFAQITGLTVAAAALEVGAFAFATESLLVSSR